MTKHTESNSRTKCAEFITAYSDGQAKIIDKEEINTSEENEWRKDAT